MNSVLVVTPKEHQPDAQPVSHASEQPVRALPTVPEWQLACQGGTSFVVCRGQVTICRSDQPVCQIPLGDFISAAAELQMLACAVVSAPKAA